MQSPRNADTALAAQLRHRPTSERLRPAPPNDRSPDDRLRQERTRSSTSRRPDDRSDNDHLRQENAELRRHWQLAYAQPSPAQPKSCAGHRNPDTHHLAGAAEEPDAPTFIVLAYVVRTAQYLCPRFRRHGSRRASLVQARHRVAPHQRVL